MITVNIQILVMFSFLDKTYRKIVAQVTFCITTSYLYIPKQYAFPLFLGINTRESVTLDFAYSNTITTWH